MALSTHADPMPHTRRTADFVTLATLSRHPKTKTKAAAPTFKPTRGRAPGEPPTLPPEKPELTPDNHLWSPRSDVHRKTPHTDPEAPHPASHRLHHPSNRSRHSRLLCSHTPTLPRGPEPPHQTHAPSRATRPAEQQESVLAKKSSRKKEQQESAQPLARMRLPAHTLPRRTVHHLTPNHAARSSQLNQGTVADAACSSSSRTAPA